MPLITPHPSADIPRRLERTLQLLRQRPHNGQELAEALQITERVARAYVYELADFYGYTIESNGAYRNPTYTLREETPTELKS